MSGLAPMCDYGHVHVPDTGPVEVREQLLGVGPCLSRVFETGSFCSCINWISRPVSCQEICSLYSHTDELGLKESGLLLLA